MTIESCSVQALVIAHERKTHARGLCGIELTWAKE